MPHSLSITDGTETVNLIGTNCTLRRYNRRSAKKDAAGNYEPVTETLDITILGTTTADVENTVRALERILDNARLRQQTGTGPRIYMNEQLVNQTESWRKEILDAELQPEANVVGEWINAKADYKLYITRRPWLEGPLTSLGTSTIYSPKSGVAPNYHIIAADTIKGSLPGPVKVQITNNTGASQQFYNVYLSTNAFNSPTTLSHILECEAAAPAYGSSTAGTNQWSNSAFLRTTNTIVKFSIPNQTAQSFKGRYARFLLRMAAYTGTNVFVRASLWDSFGVIQLAEGTKVRAPSDIADTLIDLGALPLPPAGYHANYDDFKLQLEFFTDYVGTPTFDLDFIQITPTDSFRHFVQRGNLVLAAEKIIDDGTERTIYHTEAGYDHPIFAPYGEPLMVQPKLAQRIYMLIDGDGWQSNWNFSVQFWYRPRKLTV